MKWIGRPWTGEQLDSAWSQFLSNSESKLWLIQGSEKQAYGFVSLIKESREGSFQMGTVLKEAKQRKGLATEVMSALMSFGKEHLNAKVINVRFKQEHLASLNLVVKLGFSKFKECNKWQYWRKKLV